jgi:hypothetical protein
MTDDDTMALLARVRWLEVQVEQLIDHAAQAEADRDTLAAEVRAWRFKQRSHSEACSFGFDDANCVVCRNSNAFDQIKSATDASGALTRAKEAK